MYMLVRKGNIQLVPLGDGEEKLAVVLASGFEAANWLAKHFSKRSGKNGIRAARIGSIPGESIKTVIDCAREDGLSIVVLIARTTDGYPVFQPFIRRAEA